MPDAESTVENVRVVVRVRPMDAREKLEGAPGCVSVDGVNGTVAVTRASAPQEPPRVYGYDAVFDWNTSQLQDGPAVNVRRPWQYLSIICLDCCCPRISLVEWWVGAAANSGIPQKNDY